MVTLNGRNDVLLNGHTDELLQCPLNGRNDVLLNGHADVLVNIWCQVVEMRQPLAESIRSIQDSIVEVMDA
jgi:hypothetical protein